MSSPYRWINEENKTQILESLKEQVGGTHYRDMKIQPMEYIMANGIGYCEGNIIKYVSRYKNKNGVEDLKKAQQYLNALIEAVSRD